MAWARIERVAFLVWLFGSAVVAGVGVLLGRWGVPAWVFLANDATSFLIAGCWAWSLIKRRGV